MTKQDKATMHAVKKYLCRGALILCAYVVLSVSLFMLDRGEHQQVTYGMGCGGPATVTEMLTKEHVYRQYFYTPKVATGIQILMATYNTIPQSGVVVGIGDADTDMIIGKVKVPASEIVDNQYIDVKFKDFTLDEGKKYFFEIYAAKNTEDTVVCWLTQNNGRYVAELCWHDEEVEDLYMIFNLFYDYNGKGLVLWIYLTVFFVFGIVIWTKRIFKDRALRYQVLNVGAVMLCAVVLLAIYARYIW